MSNNVPGNFMKPYAGKYSVSVIISILSVTAGLAAYALVGIIASRLFSGNTEGILAPAAFACVCKLLKSVFMNLSTWLSHHAAYDTLCAIRKALSAKMLRLPLGYFEENGSGRLKTVLADHVEGMEKTLAHMLPELTANLLSPAALTVWMYIIDWRLALITTVWIILGFSVTGGMMKGYKEKYEGQIRAYKTMNQTIAEYVGGIRVIKNFGRMEECYGKYSDAVYAHAKYNTKWQRETQVWSSLGMAIAPFSVFPVLIAGLIFYSGGSIEGGTLVMSVLLSLGIFTPLMNAMNYFDQLAQLGTNAREIRDVLDATELKRSSENSVSGSDIDFEHVTFAYGKNADTALDDVSFHIPGGTEFALVGPSGSGKSTIAKLLAGYFDASGGTVKIGGKPISNYTAEALNRAIAYVEQETFLFDGTIMNNISMGKPNADDEEVIKAAERAGCDGFIRELPEGYRTRAGAAGSRLSGGERQRIAIARAILKDAPILILDEATASADPENEAAIQQALSEAAKGKTLIVVAHRLATVSNADQIAFVQDGKIISIGKHEQMLSDCPEYAAMWRLAAEV